MPARSVRTCHVYWRGDRGCLLHQAGRQAAARRRYPHAWNLVKNPDFSIGGIPPTHWTHELGSPPSGVEFAAEDPRHPAVGKWCSKMHVPSSLHSEWRGWHQSVPIQAGRTYLVWPGSSTKTSPRRLPSIPTRTRPAAAWPLQGTSGRSLPARRGIGRSCRGRYGPRRKAASLEVHLTMLGTGTLWWGGVTVVERRGHARSRGRAAARRRPDQLDVWQMPAIVKVFQDDLPPRTVGPSGYSAARNEREPLQLAIRSGGTRRKARGSRSAPRSEKRQTGRLGDQRRGLRAHRRCVGLFLSVDRAWRRAIPNDVVACDGWSGRWPDPLLPRTRLTWRPTRRSRCGLRSPCRKTSRRAITPARCG